MGNLLMTRQYLVQGNPAVLRPREASAAQRLRSSRLPMIWPRQDLWQTRFGGNAGILGQTLPLDSMRYMIVGVMPRGFDLPFTDTAQVYTNCPARWLTAFRNRPALPSLPLYGDLFRNSAAF